MFNLVKPVLAAGEPPLPTVLIPTPPGGISGDLGKWVQSAVTWAILIGALATLAYIIFGAIDYIRSGDDAKATAAARTKITNGVTGLIILAAAFLLFQILVRLLNLSQIISVPAPF